MTDEQLMQAALEEARAAAALGEVPVGAVVAKDGEIIARAHNLRESGKNAIYHAELLAIDAACKALGGWRLWQCELFVTLEPCPMCSGAIINSRLKRVVYGARDPKAGCCGSLTDLFALPFNHHPVMEQGLLEEDMAILASAGYSRDEAYREATRTTMPPGCSEHETGLALDIVSLDNQRLEEAQEETPENIWLRENCWKYGFILRYPRGKEDITGIDYEPWHFRYVGRAAAEEITRLGLTLEEYLAR